MIWEQHQKLCESGNLAGLLAELENERDLIERECLYVGTVHMTYRQHPDVTIAIGIKYIEEFYQNPKPFGPDLPPNGDVLKRLVLLLDPAQYEEEDMGNKELAIWVCKFGLAFGVLDGTKGGFKARLNNLEISSEQ